MRVLLDENIPRKLKWCFPSGIDVVTVPERGWSGMKNGALLRVASEEFDIFISMDVGITSQQNLRGRQLAMILLSASSNHYSALLPLMPLVNETLEHINPGEVIRISIDQNG